MEGPLTMYPPADDNYGLESCSILMLSENFLCIATCGGTLYHCIILPDEDNIEEVKTKRVKEVRGAINILQLDTIKYTYSNFTKYFLYFRQTSTLLVIRFLFLLRRAFIMCVVFNFI